jgi:hypothetical protein
MAVIANAMIRDVMQIYTTVFSIGSEKQIIDKNRKLNTQIDTRPSNASRVESKGLNMIKINTEGKNIILSCVFPYKEIQLFRTYITVCLVHCGFKENVPKQSLRSKFEYSKSDGEFSQTAQIVKGKRIQLTTKLSNSMFENIPQIYRYIRSYYQLNRIIAGSKLRYNALSTLIRKNKKRMPNSILIVIMEYVGPN